MGGGGGAQKGRISAFFSPLSLTSSSSEQQSAFGIKDTKNLFPYPFSHSQAQVEYLSTAVVAVELKRAASQHSSPISSPSPVREQQSALGIKVTNKLPPYPFSHSQAAKCQNPESILSMGRII